MRERKLYLLMLGLILISLVTRGARAQTGIPGQLLQERGVTRVQAFTGNVAALSQAVADQAFGGKKQAAEIAQFMKLDLFPDVSFAVQLDHVEQQSGNSLAWYGKVEGAPYGRATFVVSD